MFVADVGLAEHQTISCYVALWRLATTHLVLRKSGLHGDFKAFVY